MHRTRRAAVRDACASSDARASTSAPRRLAGSGRPFRVSHVFFDGVSTSTVRVSAPRGPFDRTPGRCTTVYSLFAHTYVTSVNLHHQSTLTSES